MFLQNSRWKQPQSFKRRENMKQVKFHSPSRIKLVASLSGLILTPISTFDVVRRGEQFEHFLRADELGLDKRTNEKMDIVWEIEKTCPVRPLQLTTLNEDQRRLLAKIESLQSSDSPFKSSLESFIDILAAGYGSVNMSEHSAFLKIECGLTEAQCSCWECWENDLINNEGSDEKNENPDMYLSQQTDY